MKISKITPISYCIRCLAGYKVKCIHLYVFICFFFNEMYFFSTLLRIVLVGVYLSSVCLRGHSQHISKRSKPPLFRELSLEGLNNVVDESTKVDRVMFAKVFNAANAGSSESSYMLALVYLYDLLPDEWNNQHSSMANHQRAIKYLTFAAEKGHVEAQTVLGLLLYHGHNQIQRNTKESIKWLELSSSNKSPRGQWLLGRALMEDNSYVGDGSDSPEESLRDKVGIQLRAAHLLIEAAKNQVPDAWHYLGIIVEYGILENEVVQYIEQNSDEPILLRAKDLYKNGFQLGYVESGYHLALMYVYGRTVKQDYTRAIEYFRRCVHLSRHAPSMRYLAIFSFNGINMDIDYEKAIFWFRKCVEANDIRVSETCASEQDELKLAIRHADYHETMVLEKLKAQQNDTYPSS